jgi:hypothetical protein
MYLAGRILGWLIVAGYTLTVLNFFVKLINRKVVSKLPKDSPGRGRYTAFMRPIVKYHRYFAILTATALIAHLVVQSLAWGLYLTGVIAGGLLILQVSLGAYGTFVKKKKSGPWLYVHRTVAVLLFLAVVFHVVTAKFHLITIMLNYPPA